MAYSLTRLSDLAGHGFDEIIDVRSPGEFAEDHLPGAVSLPVLSDDERARVGTLYKQESPFLARKVGAALVARNAAVHIETHFIDKPGSYRPLVYCWRGGMRSGALATILKQIGWRAETLDGGYRTYRRAVVGFVYEAEDLAGRFIVLSGNTGTAKTEILRRLEGQGAQVLDLEGLAHHRGSHFGGMEAAQPSQKAFDAAIAVRLAGFRPEAPILVEDESSRIGALSLPKLLWARMRTAPRIHIEADLSARAGYLAAAYGDITADPARLGAVLERLSPYQPSARIKAWKAIAEDGDLTRLAGELMLHHYDRAYARQRARSAPPELGEVCVSAFSEAGLEAAARDVWRLACSAA